MLACISSAGCYGSFFFFQAEDGIRDGHVTGVQTCALPISPALLVAGVLALVAVVTWPLREAVYVTVAPAVATSPVAAAVAGTLAQRGPLLLVARSEEHTSELQSRGHLVCRLLLEKKKHRLSKHTSGR